MKKSSPNNHELMDLLSGVWDDRLDEESRARIEKLLSDYPQAGLETLISYSQLHLDLEWLASSSAAHEKALNLLDTAAHKATKWHWSRRHRLVAGWMAVAAAVLVVMVSFWSSKPVGHEHLIRTPQPVGRVVRVENATWGGETSAQVGEALLEGQSFDLEQGFAQLSMGFGADVLLHGPCRARILANDQIALKRGQLGVRAAEWAVGFKVETDELIATDLGTWFSVHADAGEAEVHVLEGLVLADLIKTANAPKVTRRVAADEAIEMTRNRALQSIKFRREPAAEKLKQFEPLRPVKIWNTGIGLKVGEQDPHWRVTAGDAQDAPYPQTAVVCAPHGSYGVNEPGRSQWISVERGTTDGAPARSNYTFETSFDLSGFDVATVWISGLVLADDGVDEVWLNGKRLDIKAWKDWGYGVVYTSFHPIEVRSGFVPGINRLSFVVKNETFIYRSDKGFDLPDTPNPMALRVEWQAFGRPLRSVAQN